MRPAAKVVFAWLTLAGSAAVAQNQFVLRVQQGTTVQTIADGGTITFSSEGIGQAQVATLAITYRGTTTASINGFELSGSTDFLAISGAEIPATLNNTDNTTLTMQVQFNPSANGRFTGRLSINFTEGRTTANITVNLLGVLPDFGFSYTPPRGNQTFLPAGGTIAFPDTLLNQTTSVAFVVTNRGSGSGTVNSISATGAQFALAAVPLLPATVAAGAELRFTINFTPTQLEASRGAVRIEFVSRGSSVNLTGGGIGPRFSHELIASGAARPITANETITLPPTNVGEKSFVTVRVSNTGNADGTITNIRTTGAAELTLTDVPFTPLTVTPGSAVTFNVQFAPTQPGTVTARLRVDDVFFNLSGTGQGATLTYTATVGAASTTVANNSTIVYPPTQVGSSFSARFQISNSGNAAAFVNSASATGTAFALTQAPALPARINAGETISFNVVFTPVTLGTITGTLKVDALTFNLSGVGSDPPSLPAITFPGAASTAQPADQVTVGVTLASPYPVALTGKLTLSFASDFFSDDPSIQFAAGGRTLSFTVPANTTRALFASDATQVRLQTGTVAGVITLTATFSTDGGINLTPTTAPAATIAVRPAAPRIRSVQVATRTTTGFSLLVTGYANSRSLTQMAFQFTQASDPANTNLKLDTTNLSLNVEGPFLSWYQSTASQPFGSQFTATVNFLVRGDIDAIQSVSVTATNALGTSNSVAVNLR